MSPTSLCRLSEELASKDRDLSSDATAKSSVSSDVEPRDSVHEAERVQVDLERRSNVGSAVSQGKSTTRQSPLGKDPDVLSNAGSTASLTRPRAIYHGGSSAAGSSAGLPSTPSTEKAMMDQIGIAIFDAKRSAMSKDGESKESAGSCCGANSNVGSGITGSGSLNGSRSTTNVSTTSLSNVLPASITNALPEETKTIMEAAMAKVIQKTGQELADMQVALDKSKTNMVAEREAKMELEATVARLRVKANINEDHTEALSKMREQSLRMRDERDNLEDKLVGMEVRLTAKIARHERDVSALKQETKDMEENAQIAAVSARRVMVEELAAARTESRTAEETTRKLKEESLIDMDRSRHVERITAGQHEAQVSHLMDELLAMRRELQRKDIESGAAGRTSWQDFEHQRKLEDSLKDQRDQNKKMSDDLAELRLEMLNMSSAKDHELASMRWKYEDASAAKKQVLLAGSKRARKASSMKVITNRLSCIDEDEGEDVASRAGTDISGQVSSTANDKVGDLNDFDDDDDDDDDGGVASRKSSLAHAEALRQHGVNSARLHGELEEAKSLFKNLGDETSAKEAEHQAKIARLQQQVQLLREEAFSNVENLETFKHTSEMQEAEKESEIMLVKHKLYRLQEELESADNPQVRQMLEQLNAYAVQLESVEQQLAFALESKRLLSVRLEDLKRELDATEQRHQRVVDGLRVQLESDPAAVGRAERNLLQQMHRAEEERNVIRNEFECYKVHAQTQLESEQRHLAMALQQLRDERAVNAKDQELRKQVEESLKDKHRQLVQARQAQQDAEERADREAVAARASVSVPPAAVSWAAILRCPVRAERTEQIVRAVDGARAAGHGNCQTVVWQIVSSMSEATALLCNAESLKIMEATKKAFTLWGSSALRGTSLHSLVFDKAMASWLASELTTETPRPDQGGPPGSFPGYWLRELGCVEFRSKLGSAFDSSVTCARLPEESSGRPAVVLVLVEPLAEDLPIRPGVGRPPAAPSYGRGGGMYHPGARSVASSVHSEDITANDSVSNVNLRY